MENNILELTRDRASGKDREKIKLLERLVFFLTSKPECISHTIPDFLRAIQEGLRAIIQEAEEKRVEASPSGVEFYTAIQEVMEGVIAYSRNLATEAERLAHQETDQALKQELLEIADINRHVPEFPARTFREGLTTVWICWTAIHLENPNIGLSLGRLDQVLYELYRQDIDNRNIDIQDAIELLCCLWLKIGDHVPAMPDAGEQLFGGTGSNQAITIGGVDKDGKDAVNDLTYIMLKATELMKLRDPNLNARYYQGVNSNKYLTRLCEANIITGATPALHNDKAVINALRDKGETPEHARDYGVIGCVEPGSNGRFYGHSASILLNLTSALEMAMFNGKHRHTRELQIGPKTGNPATFSTFEEFWNSFEK
jgi:formate C-acetyltransferase